MCGRFVSTNSPERIAAYFGASFDTEPLGENHNVAPTTDVYGIVEPAATSAPVVRAFHWGLVPSWAKDTKIGSRMINARAETIAEKPSFKRLLVKHRLIVPMDGFYEWRTLPGQKVKQPYFIRRRDGEPLAAAGLWSAWHDPAHPGDDGWLHSCTIITTEANHLMAPLHDRMPVFLHAADWHEWLDPTMHDTLELQRLLRPAPDDLLELIPVSTAVNNVRNRGCELIEPIDFDLPFDPAGDQPAS
ncbi:MAG: SOS response-associated peptidase [Ilumatobacteraceae bacterium]